MNEEKLSKSTWELTNNAQKYVQEEFQLYWIEGVDMKEAVENVKCLIYRVRKFCILKALTHSYP
uniref:Uncharacterized protein n=1 Tax=Timema cristinae TaxID=61476 RepID=A0A7R9D2J8_TIMCR|nr:unnamed protein product [Timema cristinae]